MVEQAFPPHGLSDLAMGDQTFWHGRSHSKRSFQRSICHSHHSPYKNMCPPFWTAGTATSDRLRTCWGVERTWWHVDILPPPKLYKARDTTEVFERGLCPTIFSDTTEVFERASTWSTKFPLADQEVDMIEEGCPPHG